MKQIGTVTRLIAVLTAMLALGAFQGGTYAQDASETTVTDGTVASDPALGGPYVSASCYTSDAGDQSTCTFVAGTADGSFVEALWVPGWIACSEVIDAGGSEWSDDGYHIESDSLSLTLAGSVTAGGGAGYVIRIAGVPTDAGGDGLICGDGEVAGSEGDDEIVDDTGNETPVDEVVPDETVDDSTLEAIPEAVDPPAGEAEAADVTDQGVENPVLVNVLVSVYNCDDASGAADPGTLCAPAGGVAVTSTEGSGAPSTQPTSATGDVTVVATEGSRLVISEAAPDGYLPLGDGSATIDSVAGGEEIIFANLLEELPGRLQIVNGICPSTTPRETEFIIIPPRTLQAQEDESPSCESSGDTVFIITGDALSEGGIVAVTDEHGIWRGYLPAGTYTIEDDSGATADVEVVTDDLTAVVVVDYFVPVGATLTVSKALCFEGEAEGTDIEVTDEDGQAGGPGCHPVDGDFTLAEDAEINAQSTVSFSLGSDGVKTLTLPVGSYVLTDEDSGQSAAVTLTQGVNINARVRTVSLTGTLVVRHYFCDDPDSNDVDPTDSSYFESNCTPRGGVDITLSDEGGDVVDTETGNAGGTITWNDVDPGIYSVSSSQGLCAAFVADVDARDGFEVEAGATTFVKVYGCAEPGDGTGDDDGDDDTGDDDSGDDDDGNADDDDSGDDDADDDDDDAADDADDDDDDVSSVTTLPQTGTLGMSPGQHGAGFDPLTAFSVALPVLLAGAALRRHRAKAARG